MKARATGKASPFAGSRQSYFPPGMPCFIPKVIRLI